MGVVTSIIMGDFEPDEDDIFMLEDVEMIAKTSIDSVLKGNLYNAKKVDVWCNSVVSGCIKALLAQGKPFKYIVTCIIMQKNGAGMTTCAGFRWDQRKDGQCKVLWEEDTMACIVTVYGLSLRASPPSINGP